MIYLEKKNLNFLWADVSTPEHARSAAKGGMIAAFIVAAVTSVLMLYAHFKEPLLNVTDWSFVDVLAFAFIAFGIGKMSRIAAVAGLVFYLVGQAVIWAAPGPKNVVLTLFLTMAFVNAVRGTISYHRLVGKALNPAASEA